MHESSSDEDGIATSDLASTLKRVRGKITIIKQKRVLKSKTRAKSMVRDLDTMTNDLKSKGLAVDREKLAQRVKNRRTIGSLEEAQDKKAKDQLGISDDSDDDDEDVEVDKQLKMDEGERRGRSGESKLLGKRRRNAGSDDEMMSDDDDS